jgi:hypothetical protein
MVIKTSAELSRVGNADTVRLASWCVIRVPGCFAYLLSFSSLLQKVMPAASDSNNSSVSHRFRTGCVIPIIGR